MEQSVKTLPPISEVSPSVISFLNEKLNTKEDLRKASSLVSELKSRCCQLDDTLSDLNRRLGACVLAYASHSDRIGGLFGVINTKLSDLSSLSSGSRSLLDGREREGVGRAEQSLAQELPALAKEVARVETVRSYAETALKLDTLVGDIEDAVSSTMKTSLRTRSTQNSKETRLLAIKSLKQIEEVLGSVKKTRPQWARLVAAADHRVDRALAILRPQAIAEHRSLLASLGWPPSLSTLYISAPLLGKPSEVPNPLFTMQGDLKVQYCENFLSLCHLQELQRQRKSRQLEGYTGEVNLHQPLWAIEELVSPISVASQRHFLKWVDKPEFIFALVYKLTRDYVDSMDELLQPLVDQAMLKGYSCREEWISSMVTALSTYLAKEIFPIYIRQLEDEEDTSGQSLKARISWLHLIDLMIAFDKRIQSLIANSGLLLSVQEDGTSQHISSLSVFCDRPDWLDLWAEIELNDAVQKLKNEVKDERNWTSKIQGAALLSDSEDYKSPLISNTFLKRLSSMTDRCRSLPNMSLRSTFIRLTGCAVIRNFLDNLVFRCQEAEGLTALADDNALVKVTISINAARYFESVLKEWCEDVFFLEMALEQGINSIFYEEMVKLEEFRTEWVDKISTVVLRGFDARCSDYLADKKQWQENEGGWTVSKSLIGALDYLQGKLLILQGELNGRDFVGVWRSLAAGIDRLLFNGVLMRKVKFSDGGVKRLAGDLDVLFGIFAAWCLRPEGFFPKTSEGLKLLKMGKKQISDRLVGGERWKKENGIRHLSAAEVGKIMKRRVFSN